MGIIHFQEMEITCDDIRMRDFFKTINLKCAGVSKKNLCLKQAFSLLKEESTNMEN